jgi:hypothetical protein
MEPGEDKRPAQRQRLKRGSRLEETGGGPMACRSVSSFVSRDVGFGRAMSPPSTQLQISIRRGCRPPRAIRQNVRRLNIEVVAFNCRRSSSATVSERETASERKNPNGNDLSAKGAFAAWTRGGIRVRAIAGAGAVGGRSTGGHRHGRSARCGNRDTRDATAISTTHHSPSATAHAPHRSTCTCARRSTSTAIGDPSGLKR